MKTEDYLMLGAVGLGAAFVLPSIIKQTGQSFQDLTVGSAERAVNDVTSWLGGGAQAAGNAASSFTENLASSLSAVNTGITSQLQQTFNQAQIAWDMNVVHPEIDASAVTFNPLTYTSTAPTMFGLGSVVVPNYSPLAGSYDYNPIKALWSNTGYMNSYWR